MASDAKPPMPTAAPAAREALAPRSRSPSEVTPDPTRPGINLAELHARRCRPRAQPFSDVVKRSQLDRARYAGQAPLLPPSHCRTLPSPCGIVSPRGCGAGRPSCSFAADASRAEASADSRERAADASWMVDRARLRSARSTQSLRSLPRRAFARAPRRAPLPPGVRFLQGCPSLRGLPDDGAPLTSQRIGDPLTRSLPDARTCSLISPRFLPASPPTCGAAWPSHSRYMKIPASRGPRPT